MLLLVICNFPVPVNVLFSVARYEDVHDIELYSFLVVQTVLRLVRSGTKVLGFI